MALFPSTLVLGSNEKLAESTVINLISTLNHQINSNPDIKIIDQQTGWGIDQIRQISSFLSLKPYCHSSRIVIIFSAQNLETAAQNALLKTLEEPGENRYLFLTSTAKNQLLETIISRCHLVFLPNNPSTSLPSVFPNFSSIREALSIATEIGVDKTQIKSILNQELATLHQNLIKNPHPKINQKIKILNTCLQFIDHHLDPKIALDYYLLKQI